MHPGNRSLLLGALSLALLAGCNFDSPWGSSSSGANYGNVSSTGGTGGKSGSGSGSGNTTAPPGGVGGESGIAGTDDAVVASVSVGGTVSVETGASEIVSVTFTSSDGLPITGFGISGAVLGTLPAGWSGPSSFTCALVAAGSNCVLNLTYAPTAVDTGTLVLNYVFVDNAKESRTPSGSVSIPYAAISTNNVLALVAPAGQINANPGVGRQTVSVNFTTDDAYAATDLSLGTSLSNLPAGWSAPAQTFTCAIVTTGSGCQLPLTYAPTAAGQGQVALNFSYVDGSGVVRNGVVNIPYATTGSNEVIATASPTGQIEGIETTGGTPVAVTFTTDDGGAASNLTLTSSLAKLPAGWSAGAHGFSCGRVSTGNGCQLELNYAPTALGSGVLTLTYDYTDGGGNPQSGLLNVAYIATTDDTVTATPSPSGQINAVVGGATMSSQNVTVTFTTNDLRNSTALEVTNLAALPPGWTSASPTFACTQLSTGTGCQLTLTFTPTAASVGTLTLDYTYFNNSSQPKTATLNIPYRSTTNDSIVGTPSATNLAVLTGSSTPVTVTFATDDTNPASMLAVTSGLNPLPAGWSSATDTFSCATVSAGTPCQLTLTYAPTVITSPGNQALTLDFGYLNDAGETRTNSVTIDYSATADDFIVAAPSEPSVAAQTGSSTPVTVTFTTNDGNPASGLTITSDLSTLPAGWSSAANPFTCATVSTGTGCQLALTYAPTVPTSPVNQMLTLDYSYTNNANQANTGSVTIDFSATP